MIPLTTSLLAAAGVGIVIFGAILFTSGSARSTEK